MDKKECQRRITMRDIKFRAWDKKRKKFNFMDLRDAIGSDDAYALCGDQGTEWSEDRENSCTMSCKCELQQFTGLITRDKVEIYEGDIVVCRDGKGLIVYEPGFAKFLIDFSPENKNRLIDCEDAFRHEDADTCMRSIRVIGNIYENPELLKGDALHESKDDNNVEGEEKDGTQ